MAALSLRPRALSPAEITFGGVWIGPGGGPAGDGTRPDLGQANADAAVAAAVAAGITEFDTAPWYGSGASEERLGRALRHLGAAAPAARVCTKAGRLFREADGSPARSGFDAEGRPGNTERRCHNDYTAAGAETSLSESLQRMGLPKVYCLRIHDPNDNSNNRAGMEGFVDEVAVALGEDGMCSALRRLRREGVVAHVGLGMNCNREAHQGAPEDVLRLLGGAGPGTFDSALLAGGWNLLTQAGLSCYVECERRGIDVHVAGVFASGLLVAAGGTYAYMEAPPHLVERTAQWRQLAEKHGFSLPAVAIAFAALPTCVTRVVLGMATPAQVEENIAWVAESGKVGPALWDEAKSLGLLDPAVPTPSA